MGGFLALLDPLLRRRALVMEADDRSVRPGERRDDEAYPGKQFAEMMLDLGDHASRSVPGGGLILEAPIADQWGMARSAAEPSEQILDASLQDVVGRESDRIPRPSPFQCLIEGGQGERRVRADDN